MVHNAAFEFCMCLHSTASKPGMCLSMCREKAINDAQQMMQMQQMQMGPMAGMFDAEKAFAAERQQLGLVRFPNLGVGACRVTGRVDGGQVGAMEVLTALSLSSTGRCVVHLAVSPCLSGSGYLASLPRSHSLTPPAPATLVPRRRSTSGGWRAARAGPARCSSSSCAAHERSV